MRCRGGIIAEKLRFFKRSSRDPPMASRPPYRLSDFDFTLPAEQIAQRPARERTASRLLHVAGNRSEDLAFTALADLLAAGDVLIFNDTRVVRSRLHARKPAPHGGKVELLLERIVAPDEAWMQLKASHPPRAGAHIELPGGASAMVLERAGRFVRLRFAIDTPLEDYLDRHAEVPLPPYIVRAPDSADDERYQTVYARRGGAVAAPTAGLHFDRPMLTRLSTAGVVSPAPLPRRPRVCNSTDPCSPGFPRPGLSWLMSRFTSARVPSSPSKLTICRSTGCIASASAFLPKPLRRSKRHARQNAR
jgi:hypothetical protein